MSVQLFSKARGRMSLRIILPAVVSLILFIAVTFLLFLPFLENSIMDHKRETIRELTKTALGILDTYHQRELSGELSRDEAQKRAARHIKLLRYGPESKDYFWINDMHPNIVVHPYRTDLEGQDVSDFTDPNGKKLFTAFVKEVQKNGYGYVDYMWQWKDDPGTIVPKLSYVEAFAPWDWILGTGIYLEDVREEIAAIRDKLAGISLAVLVAVALLTAFIIHQSLAAENHRDKLIKALAESEERHRTLVETTPHGVNELDAQGVIIMANDAQHAMLGYEPGELLGRTGWDIKHPDDRERMRKSYLKIMAEEPPPGFIQTRDMRKDGRLIDVLVAWNYRRGKNGAVNGLMSVITDITDLKRKEEELRAAKDGAEAANNAKSEFLANMSHEIRTPLNGILGMIQLLQSTDLSDEQEEYARAAINSSRRLTRLLSDILDLSRVEAGKLQIVNEPFKLAETIHQVEELFRVTAMQSGVSLTTDLDPAIPAQVTGDSTRLQQVLGNLLGNAFKFTPQGSVKLSARTADASGNHEGMVRFEVADTGIGIPEHMRDRLFEPFTQSGEGYARQYQGAGLGLAICKRLVTLMGGDISIESEPGNGSVAAFTIPLPESGTDAPQPQELIGLKDESRLELSVLLAEDDEVSGFAAARQLEKAGCEVTTVTDGKQALDALAAGEFDVVLMDVQMPVMDGLEATRAIREGRAGKDNSRVPVIAVTAYAMDGDRERFLKAGMNGYVAKPIEGRKLRQALLEAALSQKRASRN